MIKLFKLNTFSNCMRIQNHFGFFDGYKVMPDTKKFDNDNNSLYLTFLNCVLFFKNPGN
jgi:hypothetical protein